MAAEHFSHTTSPVEEGRTRRPVVHVLVIVLTTAVATVLYALRRPDELAAPYIWVEESLVLHTWLDHGWATVFHPVAGELLIWTTGLLVGSAELGWSQMPQLNYLLAVGTFIITVLMLLVPRSTWGPLPLRAAMALFLAVVPVNPETYGVLLYSFWWTALWPVLVLGWRNDRSRWRTPLLAVAGLSSLPAAACFVLYGLAARARRSKHLALAAAVLGACCAVQAAVYLSSSRAEAPAPHWGKVLEQAVIYPGEFLFGHFWRDGDTDNAVKAVLGVLVSLLLAGAIWLVRSPERRLQATLLFLALGIFAVLSAIPAPLITNPLTAGPRYYFLPFSLLGLLLLLLVGSMGRRRFVAFTLVAVLGLALLGVPDSYQRRSVRFDWHDELVACAQSDLDSYPLPVQYDGTRVRAWTMQVTPAFCASQLDPEDRAGSR